MFWDVFIALKYNTNFDIFWPASFFSYIWVRHNFFNYLFFLHNSTIFFLRSSRSQLFFKIAVLKNFTKFTGEHLCWSLFLIKRPATLLKRESSIGIFLKYCKFFKDSSFYRTPGGCFSFLQKQISAKSFIIAYAQKFSYSR